MMFMSAGASAIDLLATKPNPSESSAGVWNSRGTWKPGAGCAAQNGSATSRSRDRRTKGTGNAMAEQLCLCGALLPRVNPNRIAPPVAPHPEKMRTKGSFRRNREGVGARKRWGSQRWILFSFCSSLPPVTPAPRLAVRRLWGNAVGLTGFSPPSPWD